MALLAMALVMMAPLLLVLALMAQHLLHFIIPQASVERQLPKTPHFRAIVSAIQNNDVSEAMR